MEVRGGASQMEVGGWRLERKEDKKFRRCGPSAVGGAPPAVRGALQSSLFELPTSLFELAYAPAGV